MLYYNSIFLLLMQFETFMMLLLQKPHVLLHIIFDSTLVENEVMATILQTCLYSKRSGRLVVLQSTNPAGPASGPACKLAALQLAAWWQLVIHDEMA
jgi:hypothetical protein